MSKKNHNPDASLPNPVNIDHNLSANMIKAVRERDPDRYRGALFADKQARTRLMTLYAFHLELAKVPEMVTEPMIGAIRYQWWRDAIAEIYEGKTVRKHEVSTPLATVLLETKTPRYWVDQLIDGRERDLDPRPFETLDEARDYAQVTSGKLMQIAVQIVAPDLRLTAEQTDGINAAGLAWGMTGLARAYRFYEQGMLSVLDFYSLKSAAGQAYEHATQGIGSIPSQIMPALAYSGLVPKYLRKMEDQGGTIFDPMTDSVRFGPLAKQLSMLGTVLKGKL